MLKLLKIKKIKYLTFLLFLILISGCRGKFSEKPPIHPNLNMDFQSKKKAQSGVSREIPKGTIAFGSKRTLVNNTNRKDFLKENQAFYFGRNKDGKFVEKIPVDVSMTLLKRGRSRFNIYCAVCHDKVGTSNSPIIKRNVGLPIPALLAEPRLLTIPDGELYDIISNGIRNMPAYSKQIKEKDRWAIVAYVRALQIARTTLLKDIPLQQQQMLK